MIQLKMVLGTSISVPFIVLQQCPVQGAVCSELKSIAYCCGDDITGAVGFLAVLVHHVFTHHLGDIRRFKIDARTVQRCSDGRAVSLVETPAINVTEFQHTP